MKLKMAVQEQLAYLRDPVRLCVDARPQTGAETQTRYKGLTSGREHKICLYRDRPWFQNTVSQYVPERILQKSKITYGQVPIKAAALCCAGGEVQKAFIT
jgi:hypothetical protein